MTYFAPTDAVDFIWDGATYVKPVSPSVNFQFFETNTAVFSGDLVTVSGKFALKAINFRFEIAPLSGAVTASPVLNGSIKSTGSFLTASGFNVNITNLTGFYEGGLRHATFSFALVKTFGEFKAGFYSAVLSSRKLPTLTGSLVTASSFNGKTLTKESGLFYGNPATFSRNLPGLTGVFHPGFYTAYLKGKLAFNGSFKLNTVGHILVDKKLVVSRRYRTEFNGIIPYGFPISSISASFRTTGKASITIVCPDGQNHAANIIDQSRVNGASITLYSDEIYSDGTIETTSQTISALSISYSRGARSFSVVINGTINFDIPSTPRIYKAEGVQFESLQGNGYIRVRCDLNKDVKPTDRVVISDGREIDVGIVQYLITSNSKTMELAESGA